jgi:hypothetical protein
VPDSERSVLRRNLYKTVLRRQKISRTSHKTQPTAKITPGSTLGEVLDISRDKSRAFRNFCLDLPGKTFGFKKHRGIFLASRRELNAVQ